MKPPKRYENARYGDAPQAARDLVAAMKSTRRGIYLYGGVGVGKTHAAWSLHNGLQDAIGVRGRVYNVPALLDALRAEYGLAGDRPKLMDSLMEFRGVLFLDDIGAERMTDWARERLYLIVNRRYEEQIPTVYTSNLPLGALADAAGDRIASRIAESCDVLALGGDDRRLARYNAQAPRTSR